MKKSIFIFSGIILTLSFSAFTFMDWNDSGSAPCSNAADSDSQFAEEMIAPTASIFFYNVNSRYGTTMTKEELNKLKSVSYFVTCEQYKFIESYQSVKITILDDNYNSIESESGESEWFNEAQLKLLQSVDYSTDILFRAEYKEKHKITGKVESSYSTPHVTVVPEKEANYLDGKDALIKYLREKSIVQTITVKEDKLQPGKVSFTVTKNGTISNVKLLSTSGYPSIDKTMIELMSKAPGKWEAAENSNGGKVNQTLVFSFGIVGC